MVEVYGILQSMWEMKREKLFSPFIVLELIECREAG